MADFSPINYAVDVQQPFQAALQGYQAGAAIRNDQLQQQQQQAALQQQQRQQQALQQFSAIQNPTADDHARLMLAIPQYREQIDGAWKMRSDAQQQNQLSDLMQWGSAIKSGNSDVAASLMDARADALEASSGGKPSPESQAMRVHAEQVRIDPQFALGQIKAKISAFPNAEKATSSLTALDTLPGKTREQNAKATTAEVEANAAPETVALKNKDIRSQIKDRAARLLLDQDKLASETGVKLEELRQKNATLPDDARKIVNDSTVEATAADQSAAQLIDAADQFDKLDPHSGLRAKWGEGLASIFGTQDAVTSLRQQYVRLRTSQTMKMLPPGPASDKDIELALKGFPSENADPAVISSFLRGTAKLQQYNATMNSAKAEWVNAVGHLGKPKTDIEIDGTTVPAGSTFTDFARQFMQRKADERGAQQSVQQIQGRGYMRWANGGAQ
jgi:hypothetical protein